MKQMALGETMPCLETLQIICVFGDVPVRRSLSRILVSSAHVVEEISILKFSSVEVITKGEI